MAPGSPTVVLSRAARKLFQWLASNSSPRWPLTVPIFQPGPSRSPGFFLPSWMGRAVGPKGSSAWQVAPGRAPRLGHEKGAGHPRFPPGVPGSLSGSPPGARKLPPGSMARRGDRSIRPWQPGRGSRRQSFRGPIRGPPRATAGSLHRFSGPIRPQDSGPKGGRGRARPRASPLTPQRFRLQLGFGGFIIWLILSLFGDVSFP